MRALKKKKLISFHDRIFLLKKKVKFVYVNDITAHHQKLEESSVIAGIKHKSILLIPVCCLNHVITINPHFLRDILLQYSNTREGLLGGAHNTRRMDYIIYTQEGRTCNSFLEKNSLYMVYCIHCIIPWLVGEVLG